jgi:mRNA interferase MazF
MVKIRRGDVYWVTIKKVRRPAVVLTRDSVIPLLSALTVAPATSTERGIPAEVRLGPSDGMPKECVLSFDNIQVVPRHMLRGKITSLSIARLEEVCGALSYALGC